MRTLLFFILGAALAIIAGSTMDVLDKNITWQECKGVVTAASLVAFTVLAVILTALKKTTAHV